jgi:hypothetical protein
LLLAVAVVALGLAAVRWWGRAPRCWFTAGRLQQQADELSESASWQAGHPHLFTAAEVATTRGRAVSLAREAGYYRRAAVLPWLPISEERPRIWRLVTDDSAAGGAPNLALQRTRPAAEASGRATVVLGGPGR